MIFEFIPDSNIQPHVSIPKRDFGATDMLMGITTGMTFQSLKRILVDFGASTATSIELTAAVSIPKRDFGGFRGAGAVAGDNTNGFNP